MFGKSLFGKAIHLAAVMLIVINVTACVKKIPLEMVPFGTLDKDDYRIFHKICSKQMIWMPEDSKIESIMPYVAHYVKLPSYYFSIGEFSGTSAVASLCQSISNDQLGLTLSNPPGTIEWLNDLLRIPDLYDKISKKRKSPFSSDVQQLVQMTNNCRKTKKFIHPDPPPQEPPVWVIPVFGMDIHIAKDELNGYEKTAILKLNRLLIEEIYPDKTPKSTEKGRVIDWNNITIAIPDFKTIDDKISETAIKESCDDMEKYLTKWKVVKKVVRTVTPDTDLILEGTIVRYKAIEGMDKAIQFLQGGLVGSRLSRKYAYCFLEMKWIDAKTKDKVGAMIVNYILPTESFLERGRPEIFLVDVFGLIFNYVIKECSNCCIHHFHYDDIMNPKVWTSD